MTEGTETTEGTEQTKDTPAADTVSRAEYEALKAKNDNLYAKTVHYEKTFKDIDPEEYKALKEEVHNLKVESAGGDKEEIERLVSEKLQKQYGTTLETQKQTIEGLNAKLKELTVTSVAMQKASSIFNEDASPLIKQVIEASCDLEGDEIIVRGEDGKPRLSPSNPQKQMSLDEFLEELANTYPSCAKPRSQNGVRPTGERSSTNGSGNMTTEKWLQMSAQDRAQYPKDVQQDMAAKALGMRVRERVTQ